MHWILAHTILLIGITDQRGGLGCTKVGLEGSEAEVVPEKSHSEVRLDHDAVGASPLAIPILQRDCSNWYA